MADFTIFASPVARRDQIWVNTLWPRSTLYFVDNWSVTARTSRQPNPNQSNTIIEQHALPTMSEANRSATPIQGDNIHATEASSDNKGKGKATEPTQDVSMGEAEDDDDEDTSEDEVDEVISIL